MPNVPRTKRTFKKKRTYKRKSKPARRKAMPGPFKNFVSNDPFRPTMSVKLRYSDTQILTTGVGGVFGADAAYRINSLFDPYLSGVGHQPYGFDQLSVLYQRYKVNGARIEIIYTDPSEDGMTIAVTVNSHHNTNGSPTGKLKEVVKEQPMSVVRSINNSGKQRGVIRQYISISSVSGLTRLQFKADSDLFTAYIGNNPTLTPRVIMAAGSDRQSTGATLLATVTITFYATLYERIIQGPS